MLADTADHALLHGPHIVTRHSTSLDLGNHPTSATGQSLEERHHLDHLSPNWSKLCLKYRHAFQALQMFSSSNMAVDFCFSTARFHCTARPCGSACGSRLPLPWRRRPRAAPAVVWAVCPKEERSRAKPARCYLWFFRCYIYCNVFKTCQGEDGEEFFLCAIATEFGF